MPAKEFSAPVSQDFQILEGGKMYGTLRVKPSTLMWKPKGAHSWHGVAIEDFGEWVKKTGKQMDK